MSDISKFKVGNDTYNIKDEESRNTMAETVLSTDIVPFVSKTMGAGKYQRKKFVGCSFVWNQMIENGDFSDGTTGWNIYNAVYGYITASNNVITLTAQRAMPYSDVAFIKYNLNRKANHRYYISFSYKTTSSNGISFSGTMLSQGTGFEPTTEWTKITILTSRNTDDDNAYITFGFGNPAVGDTLDVKEVYMVDLTQLFGSTAIADYIYNLEQATAGAGVAKLKELGFFTEDYYTYDAGSVQSVDIKEYSVTGFNIYDGNSSVESTTRYSGYISVKPNTKYCVTKREEDINKAFFVRYLDTNKTEIDYTYKLTKSFTFTTPANCCYIRLTGISSMDFTSICINLSDPARNGQYEPYHKTTYPLTPTELRGVPRIDANNNIYCDGDEYKSDGGHTSNYNIVDLGTKNWSYESARSIFYAVISDRFGNGVNGNGICSKYPFYGTDTDSALGSMSDKMFGFTSNSAQRYIYIKDSAYTDPTEFTASLSGVYLVYEKATPTTETLTPFDYPQSVGSFEEITDYKVEQEDRDVAIPTGHVTEYMGKGGEFTLPTLPKTPSVLAFDGHNFFWKPETT